MKKRITALLLCLVMALSLIPATVWAAETVDVKLGTTSLTTGKTTKILKMKTPASSVYLRDISGSEIYADINKSENEYGLWQRLPRKIQGKNVFVPVDYRIPEQGSVTVSQPGIIGDCEFSLEGWKGTTYPGTGCLTFNYKALKVGTVTVTLTYYYNYGVYEIETGQWVDNNWYKETASFTVAVDDGSVDPSTKPALPNEDNHDFDDLWCRSYGSIFLECGANWYDHSAYWNDLDDATNGYSLSEVKVNDGTAATMSRSTWPWMCEMTIHVNAWLKLYNDNYASACGTHYLTSGSNEDFVIKWFWNKNTGKWTFVQNSHIPGNAQKGYFIDLWITHDSSAAAPTKPGDDTVKDILTGNIVEVYCTTEQKSNSYPLEAGTFDVSAPVKGSDGSYTCTVTLKDGADGVDKYITKAGNNHTADATQTAVTTVTLKSTNNGQTWTPDGSASFKLYAKCGIQPPLDSEPTYEDLKPLFDQKIEVKDNIRTGYTDHGTEKFGLIKDSYGMTKDNNGQVTLTIKAEKYVAAYNAKHADHALVEGAADSVQLTLEKSGDKWSIANANAPITFEVECNELTPPTEPKKTDFNDRKLVIKCVTDAQNHSSETVPYSQGDYTIDWTEDSNTCTVTFTLDKYVAYYTNKHGKHTAVANQTVTKGFHFVNGAWVPDDTPFPEIKVQCETSNVPGEPTRDDIFKALNGLVTVTCINRVWKDGNKVMDCGESKYAAKAGIVGQNYTIKQDKNNANAWIVTFPVTNFVKALKQTPAHDLYSNNTLNWSITWTDEKWTAEPVKPGVDDLVKLTHAPTDWREVNKVTHNGIWTSCENGKTGKCEYGIAVAFAKGDVVSVVPEAGVPGSYIATFKVSTYADTCAKACNDKNFKNSSRTHDLLTQETVQWKLYATAQADEKIGNQVLNHVWAAEPVTKGTDDVCQVIHKVMVTLDPNGGKFGPNDKSSKLVSYHSKYGALDTPTRDGYTFVGWFTEKDGGKQLGKDFNTVQTMDDHTLYAHWTPKTDVSYTVKYVHKDKGTELAAEKVVTGQTFDTTVTENAAAITGYTADAPTTKTLKLDGYNKELVFYYTPEVYTITYDYRDKDITGKANLQPSNPTSYTIESETIILNPITAKGESGKTFLEWRDANDGTGKKIEKIGNGTTGNLTIYAYWSYPVNYTVLDKDGKKIDAFCGTDYFAEGESDKYTLRAAPAKDGYTFDGWYQDTKDMKDGVNLITGLAGDKKYELCGKLTPNDDTPYKVEHYQEQLDGSYKLVDTDENLPSTTGTTDTTVDAVKKGHVKKYDHFTYDSSVDGTVASGTIAGNGSLVLKLYYTRNSYTVTFVPDNGDENTTATVKYGAKVTKPATDPTKTGYTFVGWFADGANTAFDFDKTTITGNITLTAHWTINQYDVTFDSMGGSKIDDQKVDYGGYVAKPTDPTKSGYTFGGWYTDNKCTKGNEFSFDTKIIGDMTLYAKWDVKRTGTNPDAKNPYIKDNTTKTDSKKVESGKTVKSGDTFDAGISLYVGLGILSLTGSAAAIYKRREEY